MQTPEEFAWTLYAEEMDFHDHYWHDKDATVRLIAARDEEIRADERGRCSVVHATLTDEALVAELVRRGVLREERVDRTVARRVPCDCPGDWQHHGRFVGDDGPETHARFDVVPSRRYVTAWEPIEGDA